MKPSTFWSVVFCSLLAIAAVSIPASAQSFEYVANSSSNNVSVIDINPTHVATFDTVVATIGVGVTPYSIAFTPDGARAYVVNEISNSVSVVDTRTQAVIGTVPVEFDPIGVVLSPDGTRAYVANQCFGNALCNSSPGTVSVIDTNPEDTSTYNTVVATITLDAYPVWLAITPDGSRVYVPLQNDMAVALISTSSNTIAASIPTSGAAPIGVAITPDGRRAYITDQGSGMVSVIDTNPADAGTYNTEIAAVTVGGRPYVPGVTPDGSRVYVANEGSSNVSVISTVNNSVTTIPMGAITYAVDFAPDGSRAYVTTSPGTLSIVDTVPSDASFNTVVATVGVGSTPIGVTSVVATDVDRFPELDSSNTFIGNETVNGNVSATNFTGNGAGLTNVNASSLGGVPASNYARTDIGNALNGNQTVSGSVTAAAFIGDGSQLTGVTASTANFATMANVATIAASATTAAELNNVMASSYARLDIPNVFNGNQTITAGNLALDNTNSGGTTGVLTLGGTPFLHNFGSQNTFVGQGAGNFSLTNSGNTGVGYGSLASLTVGGANTAGGTFALGSLTTGANNTAFGNLALSLQTRNSENSAFGYGALGNATGGQNTGLGAGALLLMTSGTQNTAVGFDAGWLGGNSNTTGSFNTFLGSRSGPGTSTQLTNATAIGANAVVSSDNSLVLGSISGMNGANSNVNVGIGTANPGYSLDVEGGQVNASGGLCIAGVCQTSWPSSLGTITGVTAGTGLTGGGSSGNVPLSVDESVVAYQSDLTAGVANAETFATGAASAAQANAVSASETFANNAFLPLTGGTLTNGLNIAPSSSQGFINLAGNSPATFYFAGANNDSNQRGGLGLTTQSNAAQFGFGTLANDMNLFTAGGNINFNTTTGFSPANPNIRMTVTAAGNVGIGTQTPAATLEVNGSTQFDNTVTFAPGQGFPGTGTITGVTAGTGLTGGGSSGTVPLSVNESVVAFQSDLATAVTNAEAFATGAANSAATTSENFANNKFLPLAGGTVAGNLAVTGGNLALDNTKSGGTTGVITLGGTPFLHNFGTANTFVGESAGSLNSSNTGFANTAVGSSALSSNTNGFDNTAAGYQSLNANTGGGYNTAFGYALIYNTTGSYNTAVGFQAGVNQNGANANTTGSANTFIGYSAGPQTPNQLINATAIGSNAVVNASNALVLGSINGVNGATSNVKVGIGTASPAYSLDVESGQINASGGFCIAGVCETSLPSGSLGTVSSVNTGAGLTGGPITSSGTISVASGGITNAMLANPSLTVAAGAGVTVTGGSPVSLGGTATVSLTNQACATGSAVTAHPFTCTAFPTFGANTFTGLQSMPSLNVLGAASFGSTGFAGPAVTANSSTGNGVSGTSSSGYGVAGSSTSSIGVYGAGTTGVYGATASTGTTTAAGVFYNAGSTNAGNILLGQYNGTNEFTVNAKGDVTAMGSVTADTSLTIGTSGTPILEHLSQVFTSFTIPAITPGNCSNVGPLTLTGASDGDTVAFGIKNALITAAAGYVLDYFGWISAANQITIRVCNPRGPTSPILTGSATNTIRVDVWKH